MKNWRNRSIDVCKEPALRGWRNPADRRGSMSLAAALALAVALAACGGGGGNSAVSNSGTAGGDCSPGLVKGFSGTFDDRPVTVPFTTGDGEGAGAGVGGGGDGAAGAGIGGALGQFVNVDVTAEFASGERFGPVRVDDQKGMVTIVPCSLKAPVQVVFAGAPGSGAQYFDEALGRNVSFEGKQLRTVMTSFDRNAGVTSFTEAMVKRTERLSVEAGESASSGWTNVGRVNAAHEEVKVAVNDLLPGNLRLEDLRRLPVILNGSNFTAGSAVLTDTQNGRYGAALAGFAQTGGANLGPNASPALEINRQFAQDMADGRIDLVDAGNPVIGTGPSAYTVQALWTNQTLQTTQSAQIAGSGGLRDAAVPFDSSSISATFEGLGSIGISVGHFSDGTLRYDLATSVANCPGGGTRRFPNVRQKAFLNAFSQDGRTFYSLFALLSGGDPCDLRVDQPFDVPGTHIVWIEPQGDFVRAADGRFFVPGATGWQQLSLEGPRQIQVVVTQGYLWGVSDSGVLIRHAGGPEDTIPDPATQGFRLPPGLAKAVPLPSPVVLIATSDDRREIFALTASHEVYWIDVRDATGARSRVVDPKPVKLDLGKPVCWISGGLVAVGCGGGWHRTVKAISDPNAPPTVREENPPPIGLTLVPGVGGVQVSPEVPAQTPIWRSTDAVGVADGTQTVLRLTSPARLIGIDGSVRTLEGALVTAAR